MEHYIADFKNFTTTSKSLMHNIRTASTDHLQRRVRAGAPPAPSRRSPRRLKKPPSMSARSKGVLAVALTTD